MRRFDLKGWAAAGLLILFFALPFLFGYGTYLSFQNLVAANGVGAIIAWAIALLITLVLTIATAIFELVVVLSAFGD
jgi:hypothetical protein